MNRQNKGDKIVFGEIHAQYIIPYQGMKRSNIIKKLQTKEPRS